MIDCNLHGFVIEKTEYIDYIKGNLVTLRHEKTKMPLFFLDREDTNKSFAIGFLTEPCDDSGVFHIIEHSVLCGSKKFPVKEPFADLMRGTVSTYLNALTYGTFTLYPVSSTVDKALFDMMDVYLDAVFNPLVLENELIFLQEGRRIEADEEDNIVINGVVLNEMREDYNSLGEIISRESDRLLHPNDGEGYVSGGVPKDILGLTYERFCELLRHHYHPSNAFCMLDGSVDLGRALGMIDGYISEFDYKEYPKNEDEDDELEGQERTALYQIAIDEEPSSKLLLFSKLPKCEQEEEDLNAAAITVLANALCATNFSPLKAAILESGICNNMTLKLKDVSTVEVFFSGVEVGKEKECIERYRALLAERLDSIIDKADLIATINAFDFAYREQDSDSTPRGVVYISNMAEYFADGSDVAGALRQAEHYSVLRTRVGTDFFPSLAHGVLLDAPYALLCLSPTTEEQDDGVDGAMEALLDKLSDEELENEIQKSRALEEWQATPDSEEALATIPTLGLSDIEFLEDTTPTLKERVCDVPLILHPIEANDITYLDLLFDISDLSPDELSLLTIYLICISDFSREGASPEWLETKTNAYLGARGRKISLYHTSENKTRVALMFESSFLDKYATEALEVISKYIALPIIDDREVISFQITQWLDSRKKALRNATNTNRTAAMGYDTGAYIRHEVYGIGLYDRINDFGP
ncbi:MAG: insulinase family protein, partial [Clostridia bacterium]|nr:insulinase family protein [Clostridia bacterium]